MHSQSRRVCALADILCHRWRIHRAAVHVVSVFQRDQSRLRVVISLGANERLDQIPGKNSVRRRCCARHASGNGGHRSQFVLIDMSALFADYLIARLRPYFDGDQVSHRPARHEERGFAAENFRRTFLQAVYRGIFAVNIVANLGLRHGAAHRR